MLQLAAVFCVIAFVSAMLGFTKIAGSSIEISTILFFFFLVAAVVSAIFGRKKSV